MRSFDVVIMGGGLAGLTNALHLRQRWPALSVAVIEPTKRPLPDATVKVGESSVEIGAHWFDTVLGLKSYLEERQLTKFGLRYFTGDTKGPLAARREIGPSEQPVVPSYQLDRGRFENDLRAMVEEAGATLLEGHSAYGVELGQGGQKHVVHLAAAGERDAIEATWLIDASGRRRILQKKLGLGEENGHLHSSAWWRVSERVDIASLVPESETRWHARDVDGRRWLSTNHLCGKGYWFWLIPLATGSHSFGIVAGEEHHPFERFARPETALAWLEEHEPVVWARIKDLPMADFKVLRHYAYTSSQIFSTDRWACVGEAAVFVDPLYSPGSDFIGLACSLASELVAADLVRHEAPETLAARVSEYNDFFLGFTEVTTATFRRHSHINGSPAVLPAKLYWDNFHYWSFVCQYFFNRIFAVPPEEHARFRAVHRKFAALNLRAQSVLKAWAEMAPGSSSGDFVPLPQFPSLLADLHIDLQNRRSPAETMAVMEKNYAGAQEVVRELVVRALKAVGPERAKELSSRLELPTWNLSLDESRAAYDEAEDRGPLRKGLSQIVRDMDRCLGRPENDRSGPSLRALWSIAMEGA